MRVHSKRSRFLTGASLLAAVLLWSGCNKSKAPDAAMLKVFDDELRHQMLEHETDRQRGASQVSIDVLTRDLDRVPDSLTFLDKSQVRSSGRMLVAYGVPLSRLREVASDSDVVAVSSHRRYIAKAAPLQGAARTAPLIDYHGLAKYRKSFPGITGSSIVVAVIDDGVADHTHPEFRITAGSSVSRVHKETKTAPVKNHPTQVAGLAGALNVGMAPKISILSYDFKDPVAALREAAAKSARISNHSYGPPVGWEFENDRWVWNGAVNADEDGWFGKYGPRQAALDEELRNTQVLAFAGAGSERNQGPRFPDCTSGPCCPHEVRLPTGKYVKSNRCRPLDGGATGLDTLSGPCLAKNAVCVTSGMCDGDGCSVPNSSFGPTDDLRIKPDLIAHGESLIAPTVGTGSGPISGTSAASPIAAGAAALLMEQFYPVYKRTPAAAEIKAILIHTAMPPRNYPQVPSPKYGWGILNLPGAGALIADQTAHQVLLDTIGNKQVVTRTLKAVRNDVRVTLVWIDRAGVPNNFAVDDPSPSLVNDLDMTLTRGTSAPLYPYRYVAGTSLSIRTDKPNRLDPVERIDAKFPVGAKVTLRIAGHKVTGDQQYALVISGAKVQ